jgi:Rrf2 family protein
MMLELAKNFENGPIQIGDIAKKQNISVKYLEQLIIPLKQSGLIHSYRGPKGGHVLAKSPEKITIGQIVRILEGGIDLTECLSNPAFCEKAKDCRTRDIWEEVTKAMYDKLDSINLSIMLEMERSSGCNGLKEP